MMKQEPRATPADAAALKKNAPAIGVGLVVSFVAVVILVGLFAALADEFPEKGALSRLDLSVAAWFQSRVTENGDRVFVVVTYLGIPGVIIMDLVVAAVLAVRRLWRMLALWLAAVGGAAMLDWVLKLIFHRERPSIAAEFLHGKSWSFPSGHAMASIAGLSMLVYLLWDRVDSRAARIAMAIGAAALTLAIGFSRIYLGVHYLSDVLAGYLAGGAWVIACVTAGSFGRSDESRARGVHSVA